MRWALVIAALVCVTIALISEFLRVAGAAACLATASIDPSTCAQPPGPTELALSLVVEVVILAMTAREVLTARR
jgi:hypothetical protein